MQELILKVESLIVKDFLKNQLVGQKYLVVKLHLGILTRVLFVSDSFTFAWHVYKGMFSLKSIVNVDWLIFWNNNWQAILTLIAGLGICLFAPNTEEISKKFKTSIPYLVYAVILLAICLLTMDKVVNFLYFQF